MIDVVDKKSIYFTVSGIAVGAALVAIYLFGFQLAVDFTGGTLWQFRLGGSAVAAQEVKNVFAEKLDHTEAIVTYNAANGIYLTRLKEASEQDHQRFIGVVRSVYPQFEELSFQSIGPSIGRALFTNALTAIALALLTISLYIAIAFRKASRPVASWKYGMLTLLTLFHDVAIPAGLLAFLGRYYNVEIDGNFVVALLVVMGFSVHDTIVVFDRVRENLILHRGRKSFGEIVNMSVNQTLARSINTSLTFILVLVALYAVGPVNLRYFVLTLLVGVTAGIYSSIFIASPGLLLVQPRGQQGKG